MTLASGRREQGGIAALYAVVFALLGGWTASHSEVPALLAWPLAGMLGAWAGWIAVSPMRGRLRWDGQAWWNAPHSGAAHPLHSVDLMMDLGGWMLLRARAEPRHGRWSPGRWCGIGRRDVGAAWHGLRLALYHGAAAPTAGAPDRTAG